MTVLTEDVIRLLEYYRTWQRECGVPSEEWVHVPRREGPSEWDLIFNEPPRPRPQYGSLGELTQMVDEAITRGDVETVEALWRESEAAEKHERRRAAPMGAGDNVLVLERISSWWLPKPEHRAWRDALCGKLRRHPELDAWPLLNELRNRLAADGWFVGFEPEESVVS